MSCALDLFSKEELLRRKEYHLKKIKELDELLALKEKDEIQIPKLNSSNPLQKNIKIKIKIIPKNSLI